MTMKTSKIIKKRGLSPIGSNKCTSSSSSSSSCARTVADIGDHGLSILSVVSSPDEVIVGRLFPCYEVIQTVYFVRCLPLLLVPQIVPLNICFSSPSALIKVNHNVKKIEVVFFWWFWVREFPLLLSFSSFQSMTFSLFFWCTTFQLCATIAKFYYKGKYIVKERGTNQSEIFIGEKQMIPQLTEAYLHHQIPSGNFSTQLGILSEQMHHLWLFQQLCVSSLSRRWSMLPKNPTKNYHIVLSKESVILNYM